MSEPEFLRLVELAAGIALSLIGVCRINQMRLARPTFALAYVGITVAAAGLALGALRPQDASEWHQTLLLVSTLVLLWDTRGRWHAGPPADSGSRP